MPARSRQGTDEEMEEDEVKEEVEEKEAERELDAIPLPPIDPLNTNTTSNPGRQRTLLLHDQDPADLRGPRVHVSCGRLRATYFLASTRVLYQGQIVTASSFETRSNVK